MNLLRLDVLFLHAWNQIFKSSLRTVADDRITAIKDMFQIQASAERFNVVEAFVKYKLTNV
jgi:hypothetical protein